MKIVFKIKETVAEIKAQIESDKAGTWVSGSQGDDVFHLSDEDNVDLFAECKYADCSSTVWIKTQMSQFNYTIRGYKGETHVTYEGAYRGLLAQNLLPTFTPDENLLDVEGVRGSTPLNKWDTMREYVAYKEQEWALKQANSLNLNRYCHPRCIYDLLMAENPERVQPLINE